MKPVRQPVIAILFVVVCTYLNVAGWALSALHQLNRAGYTVALALLAVGCWLWLRSIALPVFCPASSSKLFRRFRRPLAAQFLFFAALVWLGGMLYAPANYDALAYRLPRMANWLAAEKWFWIPTSNDRLNYSGAGWEWIAMPLLSLLRSDRSLFLINAVGFLLMPGLLFAIFRHLGVARRVAWAWMWVVPLAYGFVTQAGSIGNDLTGTILFLLAIFFGLRARRSGRIEEVWLALMAAAVMTGIKLSNLPLALPCLVAVWPALRQLPKKLAASLAVMGLAVVMSAAPIMLLNQHYIGSWTGDPKNTGKMQVKNPAAAALGNGLLVFQQAFMPPMLSNPGAVHAWFDRQLPDSWNNLLEQHFPRYSWSRLGELPMEEEAGLGLGITVAFIIVLAATANRLSRPESRPKLWPATVIAAWLAVGAYFIKMGSEAAARLLLPYYPLALVPFLLLPVQQQLLRRRSWRFILLMVGLSALPAIIFSASRPLWPGTMFSAKMQVANPSNPFWRRITTVYSTYENRNDVLAPVRNYLPPATDKIGLVMGENDLSYSLWRPFGHRLVQEIRPVGRQFPAPNMEWLVVKNQAWTEATDIALTDWAQTHHAKIIATVAVVELVSRGPENWTVLHCEPH